MTAVMGAPARRPATSRRRARDVLERRALQDVDFADLAAHQPRALEAPQDADRGLHRRARGLRERTARDARLVFARSAQQRRREARGRRILREGAQPLLRVPQAARNDLEDLEGRCGSLWSSRRKTGRGSHHT